MHCLKIKMFLECQLPALTAFLFLIGQFGLCYTTPHHRRTNAHRQYKQYKNMLKAANMTSFPEGDIRNLIIEGHEWTRNNDRKSSNSQPEASTQILQTHVASTNIATISRRQRKKEGRKGRKRHKTVSISRGNAPSSVWRKKMFSMRRQEAEEFLRSESNELESETSKLQLHSAGHDSKKAKRKERRRKERKQNRQSSIAKPIKGEKALSLNIARLKPRCKTKPMKQEIRVEGCQSKSIMNNLCYGQCNSFFIPEIRGKGNGPPSFISCGFCRPKTVRPIYVTLRCTNRRGHTRWKRKKVSYVKKCRCMEQEIKVDSL